MSAKSATVQARMEPKLKKEVDAILASLGINATTAITLFYSQMVRYRGIPLDLKIPNSETISAFEEAKNRSGLLSYPDVDTAFADMLSKK